MKNIRIITLLLICFFTFSQGMAQNCEFSKNETDKFTKDRILYTKPVKINEAKIKSKNVYSIDKVEMQVKFENKTHLIYLSYHFGMGMSMANTNSKLILLLADGSTVEAPCVQDMPDQRGKMSGAVVLSFNFKLSDDDFNRLTKANITDIRMSAQVNPVEFSLSKDLMTSALFNCINQNK